MKKLIECVPNFSEGRNLDIIQQISAVIEQSEGVKLLDVDMGATTNRTVITFVGTPDEVVGTAFKVIAKAQELIDMRFHHGDHPRFGATDVCPLVPVANITMEETAKYARLLGEKVGTELGIPVYLYENAAIKPERKNLAKCRAGEYEALKERLTSADWSPDFGSKTFDEKIAKSGATAIGARDFLLAVNYNLNTTSTRRANAIAFDVREKGRPKREGNSVTGKIVKNADGSTVNIPGTLKGTKAIGWYIEEYGIAQVSMNITDINVTPLHIAFEEVCNKAAARGIRVTGTEVVGLLPKRVMIEAADFYLTKQQRSLGICESEKMKIAIKSLGLDDLKPFAPQEKIIEYLLENENKSKKLVKFVCEDFVNETASESPAPGGGSVSAFIGSLGAALATMVANLSANKPGWDDQWKEFSSVAQKGQQLKEKLLFLVDEDTNAFNKIMEAFSLPKNTDEEKLNRNNTIQEATRYAIDVPFQTIKSAFEVFDICKIMIEKGNPNSISDAGVGVLCAKAAVLGAYLNVKINAAGLYDKEFADKITKAALQYVNEANNLEKMLFAFVEKKIEE